MPCQTCSVLRQQVEFLQNHIKTLTEGSQATINGLLLRQAPAAAAPHAAPPVNETLDAVYKAVAAEGYPIGSAEYRHTVQWAETQLAAGVGLPEVLLGIKEGGNAEFDIADADLDLDEDE